MATLIRGQGPDYHVSTGLAPFEKVAVGERLFPAEWRNAAGNDVMPPFRDYVTPLVGTIPHYTRLRRHQSEWRLEPAGSNPPAVCPHKTP
jgi:hypothetical protein